MAQQSVGQQEVFERIKACVAAQVGSDTDLYETTALQEELGLDSLEVVDLALALEREFSVDLDTQQVRTSRTLGDLTTLIIRCSPGGVDRPAPGEETPSSSRAG